MIRRLFSILLVSLVLIGVSASSAFAQSEPAKGSRFENQVKPTFSVPLLPSFEYGDISVSTSTVDGEEIRTLDIPYLSQYIGTLYKVAVGFSGIFAIVMMMIGGFQYMIARDTGMSKKGRERIVNALVGLGITLFAFVILNTINPDLVKLNSLKITSVNPVDFEILLDTEDAFGDVAAMSAITDGLSTTVPGKYRSTMFAACGNRDGASLATYSQKIERLKSIVKVWAEVGANQGGALYINGGDASCTTSYANPNYILNSLANPKLAPRNLLDHPNIAANPTCRALLKEEMDYILNKDSAGAAHKEALAAYKIELSNFKKANPNATAAELPKPPVAPDFSLSAKDYAKKILIREGMNDTKSACYLAMHPIYTSLLMKPAHDAGLLCGDCGSTIASLYDCFDKSAGSVSRAHNGFGQGCADVANRKDIPYVPGCNLIDPTMAQMEACIKNLKFGDVFGTSKHVFMYTGGDGGTTSPVGFGILEMGGGGTADDTCDNCGGVLASKIAGISPLSASGMKATIDGVDFLKKKVKRTEKEKINPSRCLFAWRPIQP